MYRTLKTELADWREIEDVIDIVSYSIGLLDDGTHYPKYMYASSNPTVEVISCLIFKLVEIGVLERRDDRDDIEVRWNSTFIPEWQIIDK